MNHQSSRADTTGRTIIVTGAAKRLGREIALGLARDGWNIVVHYHASKVQANETATDIQALGRHAVALGCDLRDQSALDAFFEQALGASANLCGLVNNASHFAQDRPSNFDANRLAEHIGPNLAAPLRLAQHLYNHLGENQRGVIVNMLDQKLRNLNPDFYSYTLTKHALLGATKMMAMDFAPRLRVVGVSPGLTLPSYLQDDKAFDKSHREAALLDHSSRPEDIVAAVVFLAGQPSITGVDLTVDGGQHLMGLQRDVSYLKLDQ